MSDERREDDFNQNSWQYKQPGSESSTPQEEQKLPQDNNHNDIKEGFSSPQTHYNVDNEYSGPSENTNTTKQYRQQYQPNNSYFYQAENPHSTESYPEQQDTFSNQPNLSYNQQYQPPYSTPYTPPLPMSNGRYRTRKGLKALAITLAVVIPSTAIGVTIASIKINYSNKDDSIKYDSSGEYSYYVPENSWLQTSQAPDASANPNGPQIETASTPENSDNNEAVTIYNKVSPSIVGIISYPAGTDYTITESGEGSGIIISSDGYIATNSHVINDSKDTGILVKLSTNEEYIGAVVGFDKRTDLAVVKIDAKNLPVAEFANSDSVTIGQNAYAIGNPGGLQFSNSLTKGTISAINRTISSSSAVKYIQTDAAINPGNSGGALINSYSQIIGINTSKLVSEEYEGMGFAIPSNTVISIVNNIIRNGYVKGRAYLGITASEWSTYAAKKNDTPVGVKIESLSEENAFSSSDVQIGDIITEIDGKTIKDLSSMFDAIDEHKPGDRISIKLFRLKNFNSDGKAKSFSVSVVLLEDTGQ